MVIVNFYLRTPYRKTTEVVEKVKQFKKQGKSVPKNLLNDRQTSVLLALTLTKKMTGEDRATVLKFNTNFKILPRQWDFDKCLPAAMNEFRTSLEEIKLHVIKEYSLLVNALISRNEDLSLNALRKMVEGVVNADVSLINKNNIYDALDDFIRLSPGIETERTKAKYETLKKHLELFEEATGYKLNFDTINAEFLKTWSVYMTTKYKDKKTGRVGLLNNTVNKNKICLKTFLRWAHHNDYHKNLFYEKISSSEDKTEVISLNYEEFNKIIAYVPEHEHLVETRDVFLFAILTAQRYADIAGISWEEINLEEKVWNVYQRKGRKTTKTEIPLHPYALQIIQKYQGSGKPLPVVSNQKYNDNIKDLCKLAGIDTSYMRVRYSGDVPIKEVKPKWKFISSHTARKSFLNIAPELGIPMDIALAITGHADYKTVQDHYRKVSLSEKRTAINKIVVEEPKMKVM